MTSLFTYLALKIRKPLLLTFSYILSKDISSTNISKSTTDTKEKIEHSYLNTSEASTKIFTPNDTIQSIETQEISACSQVITCKFELACNLTNEQCLKLFFQSSQSLSHDESEQDNDDSSKSEIKTETQIDQVNDEFRLFDYFSHFHRIAI